jgi:hypothetical protein
MFVIPFLLRVPPPSLLRWRLQPILVFLENHGKQLCSAENPSEWLAENGFTVKRCWTEKEYYFAEIDDSKTCLKDFYSFEQLTVQQKKGTEECWRTFYMMISPPDEKGSEKDWNDCIEDPFRKVLDEIQTKSLFT